jgi:beta-glucanase (GH16 family)
MIRLLSRFALAFLALAAATPGFAGTCPALQPASNMVMTFDSEFYKTGVFDTTQWNPFPNQPATIGNEQQAYIPSQVQMVDGLGLQIATDKEQFWNKQYVSAEVSTRGLFSQAYGHFEMKARVPQADGLWPAFWLIPENNTWPPEIDVLEYIYAPFGQLPTKTSDPSFASGTLHWETSTGAIQQQENQVTTPTNWGAHFHVYSIDWRPGQIVWAIDGAAVYCVVDTASTGTRVPSTPMFMIIDDAIGPNGGWSGTIQSNQTFPLNFDVAYVRVYQFKDSPAVAPLPGAVRNTTVSQATVAPGGTVTINSNLVIGNANLGYSYTYIQIKNYDGSQSLATLTVNGPTLNANTTYPISATYTVPASMPPGLYVVSIWTAYNNWQSDFYDPEAQMIEVAAPPA